MWRRALEDRRLLLHVVFALDPDAEKRRKRNPMGRAVADSGRHDRVVRATIEGKEIGAQSRYLTLRGGESKDVCPHPLSTLAHHHSLPLRPSVPFYCAGEKKALPYPRHKTHVVARQEQKLQVDFSLEAVKVERLRVCCSSDIPFPSRHHHLCLHCY